MHDDERHIPVRISREKARPAFAKGGLVSAAEQVRGAGRMGDDMVVHVNRREFEEMMGRWGEPTINPETGLPEFFLGDLWDGIKDFVAPVASALLPGIGAAIGSYLPGIGPMLGGALGTAAAAPVAGAQRDDGMRDGVFANSPPASESGGFGGLGALLGGKGVLPALLTGGATLLGGILGGEDEAAKDAAKANRRAQAEFNKPLPVWQNERRRVAYDGVPDYTQEGEREYFEENRLADGGPVGYISGDGGAREDKIEALLSDGEYVIDAETLALLGDGSTEAGAEKMDMFRENIRKHKGSALAAGAISPDALAPEQYLMGAA